MLLSVDVGLKNMAVCVMTVDRQRVEYVEVIDLRTGPNMRENVIRAFEERRCHFEGVTVALVEQQLKKIFMVLAAYVEMWVRMTFPTCDVMSYSSRHKLADVKPNDQKWTYAQRKRASINLVTAWLTDHPMSDDMTARWTQLKKKDDVADAICQALSYKVKPIVAVLVARRPEPSRQKLYTKSHIKWLLLNGAEYETDDKLKLSIAKFWIDLAQCRQQCGIADSAA